MVFLYSQAGHTIENVQSMGREKHEDFSIAGDRAFAEGSLIILLFSAFEILRCSLLIKCDFRDAGNCSRNLVELVRLEHYLDKWRGEAGLSVLDQNVDQLSIREHRAGPHPTITIYGVLHKALVHWSPFEVVQSAAI